MYEIISLIRVPEKLKPSKIACEHWLQKQCKLAPTHTLLFLETSGRVSPGAHISTAGCKILGGVHPVCARFLSHLLLLYIERVHGAISGCTVLWEVHPASAQNNSLILDTDWLQKQCKLASTHTMLLLEMSGCVSTLKGRTHWADFPSADSNSRPTGVSRLQWFQNIKHV